MMTGIAVHRVWVCTPGAIGGPVAPGEVAISSSGILDQSGFHGPEEVRRVSAELPEGSVVYAGRYDDVLEAVVSGRPEASEPPRVGIVLARRNEMAFESFLEKVRSTGGEHGITSWMGGVAAALPATAEGSDGAGWVVLGDEDRPSPVPDVAVLSVPGSARSRNVHDVVRRGVAIEGDTCEVRTIDGSDPFEALMAVTRSIACPADLEHVTLTTGGGRNVHLSKGDDGLRSGATLPGGFADIRAVSSIVAALDRELDGYDLAFSCAGLGGALEALLVGRPGVVAWMYGEVVDLGSGPELGNLMTTVASFGAGSINANGIGTATSSLSSGIDGVRT